MSKERILDFHQTFFKECPDGLMNQTQFIKYHKKIWPSGNPDKYCLTAFKIFDLDKNGMIDFEEFLLVLSMYGEGSFSTISIQTLFKFYDQNGDIMITKEEMLKH